jgi:3-hydroxyisobutyrate dehydrogenase-like beta-hydroxyacid dehydrogenase
MAKIKSGVIGLGRIGKNVALGLDRAGLLEAVYDIRPEVAGTLEPALVNAGSPAELARRCDVVIVAVFDAAQARDVLAGPEGIFSAAHSRLIVLLVSTVSLNEFRALHAAAAQHGIELLDCCVTGGYLPDRGGWVVFVGGEGASVNAARPAIDAIGRRVFHMGPPGTGLIAKLAKNAVFYATCRAEHEGVLLARAAGLAVHEFVDAVQEARAGTQACMWAALPPVEVAPDADVSDRRFFTATLEKDLDAALRLAQELGVRMPATELTRATGAIVTGLKRESCESNNQGCRHDPDLA